MNKSMLVGSVLGAAVAIAGGGIAGYKMLEEPKYAEVVAVTPVTERIETPREECHEEQVTRRKPWRAPRCAARRRRRHRRGSRSPPSRRRRIRSRTGWRSRRAQARAAKPAG